MYTQLSRTLYSTAKKSIHINTDSFKRFFAKIYNFKSTYPILYEHIHPDSLHLFEGEFIDSTTVVKWLCPKGPDHIWESDIASRIRSFKRRNNFVCLYCLGKKISVTNSLEARFPDIAKEWDYEKNGTLTPNEVTCHSCKDVWWICPNDSTHRFLMSPNDRTFYHNNCPYCSQKFVSKENSLLTVNPELAKQWDYQRNGALLPETISPLYSGKVWWICPTNENHHWKSSVAYRIKHNSQCPHCRHTLNEGGTIASLFPDLAKEWDYEKNGKLTPNDVSITSSKTVWWKCEHGVEWKQSVIVRQQNFVNGYHRCEKCRDKYSASKSPVESEPVE